MSASKVLDKETRYSEDSIELVNATPKHSIIIISAPEEMSLEDFQQQVNRLNELREKYETLYIRDAMLLRIQHRGLCEILRARIIQILSKMRKYVGNQVTKDAISGYSDA